MKCLGTTADTSTHHYRVDDNDDGGGGGNNAECLAVMQEQDRLRYRCRDYLGRRRSRRRRRSGTPNDGDDNDDDCDGQRSIGSSSDSAVDDEDASCCYDENVVVPHGEEPKIDAVCREKMCEWGYKVCDHFRTSREIVAFAFSFLDRFVDRHDGTSSGGVGYCCYDRTSFKLAAMTSLYMATKIFNPKHISITSLAELSRGEFDTHDIAEMERTILETLEWRLNPPTAQGFIDRVFDLFLPSGSIGGDDVDVDPSLAVAVYQRSVFFAELAVYDYSLITEQRVAVAIACIFNAMEGIDGSEDTRVRQEKFLDEMESRMNVSICGSVVDDIQGRLWLLYSCSAQLKEDTSTSHLEAHHHYHELHQLHHHYHRHRTTLRKDTTSNAEEDCAGNASPVSVNMRGN